MNDLFAGARLIENAHLTWYLLVGSLLLLMCVVSSLFRRWPVSPAMLYLGIGYLLGQGGIGLIDVTPSRDASLLLPIAELALLLSLFTVGLKLRLPLTDPVWRLPLRLGVPVMLLTVLMLTTLMVFVAGMPAPVAMLVAAILAPTDPVLASDVQIHNVGDRDVIRTGLTGEGGLNDGTAYPMMMIALAWLGVPMARAYAGQTIALHIIWGIAIALVLGGSVGLLTSRLVVWLRRHLQIALGMEEFFAVGLIGLTFGLTELLHGIGFLAVFAAGVAVRGLEAKSSQTDSPDELLNDIPLKQIESLASDPKKGPAYMAASVMEFNQQLEHFVELAMVTLTGVLVSHTGLSWEGAAIALVLFFVIRPLAVRMSLIRAKVTTTQLRLTGWFGIRGIGSLYYLLFALQYHWSGFSSIADGDLQARVPAIVLTVIAMSIVLHGISATPLMAYYRRVNPSN